jgi:NAD(P)-dependent dehydrogenase (short-subunit alcohol dehydrogenase family)
MSKTIFITGASTGLGKASARLFASKGWNVIATMRKPENEKELNALPNITLMTLDVTNAVQIKKVVEQSISRGLVDVVFNNAGYGSFGPLEAITDEEIMHQLNTNLLGVMRVTQAFIPHFREKKNGLFITTTSVGGLMAYPLCSIYHATKWGLEGWSESMAFELKQFGIGIKTVAPGGIKTDFSSRSMQLATHPAYADQLQKLSDMFVNNPARLESYSTPEEIADVVYEAATDGKDQLRYVAGASAQAAYARRLQVGDEAFRKGIEQMWLAAK